MTGANSVPSKQPRSAMSKYLVAALYKFVRLDDYREKRAPLLRACADHDVMGSLLLAAEGINGTIAGPEAGVRAVLAYLRGDERLADLEHKESWNDRPPFKRMKVRLKKEIVTMGVDGIDPTAAVGTYVDPAKWNDLIRDPDVVVIDTRNDYEVGIGTFEGALDPDIKTFREFPSWFREYLKTGRKRVAMFCTGGIRCEKSTAFARQLGVNEVYHLKGGILKYLEEMPEEESLWRGECYVFDGRVSVGHGLKPGPYDACPGCGFPIDDAAKAHEKYQDGICCANCADTLSDSQKARFAERKRQADLAAQRHGGGNTNG